MKLKIVITLLLLVVAVPVIFIGSTIINSKDCDQIVIDTYEIHSGIDIPEVEPINCYFDDAKDVRLSIYSLRGLVNHDQYLSNHNFEPISLTEITLPVMLIEDEKPKAEKLYVISGTTLGRKWRYIVEKETNRLWAEIQYN